MKKIFAASALLLLATSAQLTAQQEKKMAQNNPSMETMYIGTYTKEEGHVDGQAEGIYTTYRDPITGILEKGKTVARPVNPSFVKVSPNGKFLFAVSELGPADGESGFVHSYRIKGDDSLEERSKLSTEGLAPAHVETDRTGRFVFVSNYLGGVVMVYKVLEDGSLQKQQRIDLQNPEKSHAHSTTISHDNKHAYVADLGNDKIWIFNFSPEEGKMTPANQKYVELPEDSGPRHFTISKNGKFAYAINELNNTVTALKVEKDGGLEILQHISSLPKDFSGKNSASDIHLHPNQKFLYVSNRGEHNSITSYTVDSASGKISYLETVATKGEVPRAFAISPDGDFLYVANQNSNNIVTFRIDEATGKLTPSGEILEIKTPVSIEFLPVKK